MGSISVDPKVVDGLTEDFGVLEVFVLLHPFNEGNPILLVILQIPLQTLLERCRRFRLLPVSLCKCKLTAMEQCLNKHTSAIMAIHIVPH